MKYLNKCLCSLVLLCTLSCEKDDSPQDPVSQLPPATMTGANTFGALLDGEAFIPSGGINPLDAQYQLINGDRFFVLEAAKRDEDFNGIALSLSTNAKELQEGGTYILGSEFTLGGVSGKYIFNGDIFDTDDQNSGELTVSKLDLNTQIISGTFFYDVIDGNGNLRRIREGRFDMRFTQ